MIRARENKEQPSVRSKDHFSYTMPPVQPRTALVKVLIYFYACQNIPIVIQCQARGIAMCSLTIREESVNSLLYKDLVRTCNTWHTDIPHTPHTLLRLPLLDFFFFWHHTVHPKRLTARLGLGLGLDCLNPNASHNESHHSNSPLSHMSFISRLRHVFLIHSSYIPHTFLIRSSYPIFALFISYCRGYRTHGVSQFSTLTITLTPKLRNESRICVVETFVDPVNESSRYFNHAIIKSNKTLPLNVPSLF